MKIDRRQIIGVKSRARARARARVEK